MNVPVYVISSTCALYVYFLQIMFILLQFGSTLKFSIQNRLSSSFMYMFYVSDVTLKQTMIFANVQVYK